MKVLFSLDNYDHGSGGAEASARGLARYLAARGHGVEVLQQGDAAGSYNDGEVHVHTHPLPAGGVLESRQRRTVEWNRLWRARLDAFLSRERVDLVVTQAQLLPASVDAAAALTIPVAAFVRAYRAFCPTQFRSRDPLTECPGRCLECLPWYRRVTSGALHRDFDVQERALRDATAVFANSRYMQAVIRKFLGVESQVVYPAVDAASIRDQPGPGDAVLFVKPQLVKGLPIFLEVARRMPDTRFVVAGKTRSRVRRALGALPNVEMLGWVQDMNEAYARARVLLAPSIWPEPFGRVFVEAGARGIPSVGSARGGIPEAVGDGGLLVDDVFDIESWIAALRQLEDADVQASYAARAREHARHFSLDVAGAAFVAGVQKASGIAL